MIAAARTTVLLVIVAAAGCAPRQAEGWKLRSKAGYTSIGESTIPVIVRDSPHPPEIREAVRATLGEIYAIMRNLDAVAANTAEVKRTDEQWAELSAQLAASYEALRAAAALPAETLAQGTDVEQVRNAIDHARAVVLRFGGGFAFDQPLPPLDPRAR